MYGQNRKTQERHPFPQMLRERELAARWSLSQRTLQRWRAEGYGPPYLSIGGAIRYRLDEVEEFENATKRGGEAQ